MNIYIYIYTHRWEAKGWSGDWRGGVGHNEGGWEHWNIGQVRGKCEMGIIHMLKFKPPGWEKLIIEYMSSGRNPTCVEWIFLTWISTCMCMTATRIKTHLPFRYYSTSFEVPQKSFPNYVCCNPRTWTHFPAGTEIMILCVSICRCFLKSF